MIPPLLLLDAAAALPASQPMTPIAAIVAVAVAVINTVGLVLVARKKPAAPKATEDLGQIRNDLKAQGGALGELKTILAEIEARGPGASQAQVKAALARVSALEGWKREREQSDERRRASEHEQDLKLERLLGRFEAKLEGLEKEDRDGRRSRS